MRVLACIPRVGLRQDLHPMWDDVQKNGPMAMMKWYNDPKFVAMIQEKMGDVQGRGAPGIAARPYGM